jgi:hypothetical protein
MRKIKHWCESEKEWLKIMYPYIPNKILAERFGASYKAVEKAALRLGLVKDRETRRKAISEGHKIYQRSQ